MSEGLDFAEPTTNDILSGSSVPSGPSDEDFDLAVRIIKRLEPADQNQIFELVSGYGQKGGMALTATFVFWWLLIFNSTEDVEIGRSIFFKLDFSNVALTVLILGAISTFFAEASRKRGSLMMSLISGGMLIMCGLYTVEPLFVSMFLSDLEMSTGIYRSIRLAALWGGAWFGSSLIALAINLTWVRRFCEQWDYEFGDLTSNEPISRDLE